jgi:hypothetical protein
MSVSFFVSAIVIAALLFMSRTEPGKSDLLVANLEKLPVYPQAQNVSIVEESIFGPSLHYTVAANEEVLLSFYADWFAKENWRNKTSCTSCGNKTFTNEHLTYGFETIDSFPWITRLTYVHPIRMEVSVYTLRNGGQNTVDLTVRAYSSYY